MRIGTPELLTANGRVTWSAPVAGLPGPDRLWFTVPDRYADLLTRRADPAVVGLLIPAMRSSESIFIDAPATDELIYNVRYGYQDVMHRVIGDIDRVSVEATHTLESEAPAAGVGTGFSAGVDSFAVIVDHHLSAVPPQLRLTHLTYFNVGSHGRGRSGRDLFNVRLQRLAPVAADIGLPLVPVDSNLDDFYDFANFQQTNGPRTMSAALLLQGGIGRYYLASSFSYEHIGVRRSRDTAFSDPISLPLLTTGHFRPIPHGDSYSRVEKTLLVASAPISHVSLDVCVHPLRDGANCSRCFKCLRTQLTLEIAGRLQDFGRVFDLALYRRERAAYLYEVAVSTDEFAAEIRNYARISGFRLPRVPPVLGRGVLVGKRKAHSLSRKVSRFLERNSWSA